MKKNVLVDLAYLPLSLPEFKALFEQHETVYVFHRQDRCEFALSAFVQFSELLQQGRLCILNVPTLEHAQQENTVLAGLLLGKIHPNEHILVVADEDTFLDVEPIFSAAEIQAQHTDLAKAATVSAPTIKAYKMPPRDAFLKNPQLVLVKRYCEALDKMDGKPTHIEALKNSIGSCLNIDVEACDAMLGLLSNLKIIKCQDEQVSYRKKIIKQWAMLKLDVEEPVAMIQQMLQSILPNGGENLSQAQVVLTDLNGLMKVLGQKGTALAQVETADLSLFCVRLSQELLNAKHNKPKNLFELRDLLEQLFPETDVKVLLKNLLDQGYIHWDGVRLVFGHELSIH